MDIREAALVGYLFKEATSTDEPKEKEINRLLARLRELGVTAKGIGTSPPGMGLGRLVNARGLGRPRMGLGKALLGDTAPCVMPPPPKKS